MIALLLTSIAFAAPRFPENVNYHVPLFDRVTPKIVELYDCDGKCRVFYLDPYNSKGFVSKPDHCSWKGRYMVCQNFYFYIQGVGGGGCDEENGKRKCTYDK